MKRFCALAGKGLAALGGLACRAAILATLVGPALQCAAAEPGGQTPPLTSAANRPAARDAPARAAAAKPDRARESIVDLRQLAAPARARFAVRTAAEIEATVPLTPLATFDFYEGVLARDGWVVVISNRKAPGDKSVRAYFEKGIASLSLSVAPGGSPDASEVALRDRGDLDTERLPRLADSEIASRSRPLTVYLTTESVAVVAETLARLLPAAGWRGYKELDAAAPSAGSRNLWFRRSRDSLTVSIVGPKTPGGKTRVSYSVRRMAHATPTPPDAKDVELHDAKWQARCRALGDVNAVADFYRSEMADYGYRTAAASSAKPGEKLLRFEGDDRSSVLVNLTSKGQSIAVSLQGMSAEQLSETRAAARSAAPKTSNSPASTIYAQDLPLPADAKQVTFAPTKKEITFRLPNRTRRTQSEPNFVPNKQPEITLDSPSESDIVIGELRDKLKAAGWRERSDASLIAESGGMAEFQQGDASLLIMLDQETEGAETEVTITGKGIFWR